MIQLIGDRSKPTESWQRADFSICICNNCLRTCTVQATYITHTCTLDTCTYGIIPVHFLFSRASPPICDNGEFWSCPLFELSSHITATHIPTCHTLKNYWSKTKDLTFVIKMLLYTYAYMYMYMYIYSKDFTCVKLVWTITQSIGCLLTLLIVYVCEIYSDRIYHITELCSYSCSYMYVFTVQWLHPCME